MAVSSPCGDVRGAEEAAAVAAALAPDDADGRARPVLVARPRARPARPRRAAPAPSASCSSATSTPSSRTTEHRPLRREGDRLVGSGTVDMKGGDVLALGVLRALADAARGLRRGRAAARVRRGVARRAVRARRALRRLRRLPVLRGRPARRRRATSGDRQAQGGGRPLRVHATGRSAHSRLGPAPRHQRAARARRRGAGGRRRATTRDGARAPDRRADGHALGRRVQRRARPRRARRRHPRRQRSRRFARCVAAVPGRDRRRALDATLMRVWPGMDSRAATGGAARARERGDRPPDRRRPTAAGRATRATSRRTIPLTVDGLGPLGGGAHAPHEFVLASSLRSRAEVALAIADAVLAD